MPMTGALVPTEIPCSRKSRNMEPPRKTKGLLDKEEFLTKNGGLRAPSPADVRALDSAEPPGWARYVDHSREPPLPGPQVIGRIHWD